MLVVRHAPRRNVVDEYANWLYTHIPHSASAIDFMRAFDSSGYSPEPAATVAGQIRSDFSNGASINVSFGMSDFDVIVGVVSIVGSTPLAPSAALQQAVIFHRVPSPEPVLELVQPLFVQLQEVPGQSVVDRIVSEAEAAGYSVSVVGTASGLNVTQQSATHSIDMSQLGIALEKADWAVVTVPSISQSAVDYSVILESVIASAPGESLSIDWMKSGSAVVAVATLQVTGEDHIVSGESNISIGGARLEYIGPVQIADVSDDILVT